MASPLTQQEIRSRALKLANYERLHPQLKERTRLVRQKNKALRAQLAALKQENKEQERYIQKILLELEELKEKIYGRKQRERRSQPVTLPDLPPEEKAPRSGESYRRPVPNTQEITAEATFDLVTCPDCGRSLIQKEAHTHYREDIAELAELTKQTKTVTKRIIASGYCTHCSKRKSALPIPKQTTTLGTNIKGMIVYLSVLRGMSYREIQDHCKLTYNLSLSTGEIANSLASEADLLRPVYQTIFDQLQTEHACHYDESSWDVHQGGEGNYIWVKTGAMSNNVLFWFGKSRGKGVAEKLRGSESEQVGITDDYGSYRTLFTNHQLCWAHPHRKLRDLAQSALLDESIRKHCATVYDHFKTLYHDVQDAQTALTTTKHYNHEQHAVLMERFEKITIPHPDDPEKLQAIKASLAARKACYFLCLTIPNIPLDNNKAERTLRKVVLKRKKSFGSQTQKGADVLTILYSVVFSLYWSHPPQAFFSHYQLARNLHDMGLTDASKLYPMSHLFRLYYGSTTFRSIYYFHIFLSLYKSIEKDILAAIG